MRRVEINLGWACNNDCVFCGEQDRREHSRKTGQFLIPGDKVRADLRRFREEGFDHLTFLGGEPTIRKDMITLVRFARDLGFRYVFMTTNGRRMADRRFLRSLLRAGLTDLCVSVHGPDAETHDAMTVRPGSFAQTERALLNLVLERQRFHVSSVLARGSIEKAAELVRYLHQFRPTHIYLALPNPAGGAYRRFREIYPTYSEAGPLVRAALAEARALGQMATIAKLPYCHLEGFEGYSDALFWGSEYKRQINVQVEDAIDMRFADRSALAITCERCRYRLICEGVEAHYVNLRGVSELVPVEGELVTDPGDLRATGPLQAARASFAGRKSTE